MKTCSNTNGQSCPQRQFCPAVKEGRDPTWVEVAGLYPAPRDCLAAFVAVSAAEVLAGVKPANLIRIVNRRLPCGRRLYRLWRKYGMAIVDDSPLSVAVMREEQDSVLLLFYDEKLLQQKFRSKTMQAFLGDHCGIVSGSLEEALNCLRRSFRSGVPHEIGAFLGYPLKDVRGFIKGTSKPFAGGGMWRIFGPPARSLRLNDLYRRTRSEMMAQLLAQTSPVDLLRAA